MGKKKRDLEKDQAYLHANHEDKSDNTPSTYADLQYLLHSHDSISSTPQTGQFDIVDRYGDPGVLHIAEENDNAVADKSDVKPVPGEFDLEKSESIDIESVSENPDHTQPESPVPANSSRKEIEVDEELDSGTAIGKGTEQKKFKFLQSPGIVGLDYSNNSLKYIVLRKSAKGYRIEYFGCEELGRLASENGSQLQKDEQRLQKVHDTLAKGIQKSDLITSSISGLDVIYRMISVPKMGNRELADAIPWALRKDLPFGIETASVNYKLISKGKAGDRDTLNIATLATPTEIVDRHLNLYSESGIMPVKITSVAIALWNVILQQKTWLSKKVLVVEIGASACQLVFVNNGVLEFHREITTAGNEIIEAITDAEFFSIEDGKEKTQHAFEILQNYVVPDKKTNEQPENGEKRNAIDTNILQVLERLVSEIVRSIDYYKEKFFIPDIDTVLLCGGGALISGLETYLSNMLELPVEILNPLQCEALRKTKHKRDIEEIAPRMAVAIGLALDKGAGPNLLPKKLQRAHKSQKAIKLISYLFFILFICFFMATGYYTLIHTTYSGDLQFLETKYRLLTPQKTEYIALSNRLEALQFKQQAYSKRVRTITSPEAHLRAISNLVPRSIALLSITIAFPQQDAEDEEKLDEEQQEEVEQAEEGQEQEQEQEEPIQYEEITLRGIVFPDRALEGANLSSFLLNLLTSGYFQDVEITEKEIKTDGTIGFVVKCYY